MLQPWLRRPLGALLERRRPTAGGPAGGTQKRHPAPPLCVLQRSSAEPTREGYGLGAQSTTNPQRVPPQVCGHRLRRQASVSRGLLMVSLGQPT